MSELNGESHPLRRNTDRLPETGFEAWKRVYTVQDTQSPVVSKEIVFFDIELGDQARTNHNLNELHLCIDANNCQSDLVYPIAWKQMPDDMWRITCRCPNCETYTTFDAHQKYVEVYDDRLNDGTSEIQDRERELWEERTAEEIGRFVTALERDWILPEDF